MTTFHLPDGGAIVCDDMSHDVYDKKGNLMRTNTRGSRYHAHDEGGRDLDGAYKHLYKAMDHLHDARAGKIDFDEDVYNEHVTNAGDCLKAGAQDDLEDESAKAGGSVGAPRTERTGTDRRSGARDALPRGIKAPLDVGALFGVPNTRGGR